MFIASLFLPGISEAQLGCPNFHYMFSHNPTGCDMPQHLRIDMDKTDEIPYEITEINVLIYWNSQSDLLDFTATQNSINTIFQNNGWIVFFTHTTGSNSVNLSAHWNNGTGTPILFNNDLFVFDLVWNGDISPPQYSHAYSFNFFQNATYLKYLSSGAAAPIQCYPNAYPGHVLYTPTFAPVQLTGTVRYRNNTSTNGPCSNNEDFPNLTVNLTRGPINILASDITNIDGEFTFADIQPLCQYEVRPVIPQNPPACGLENADVQYIRKLVLGQIGSFLYIWQYIAADVNQTNTITTADINKITSVMLGYSTFLSNFRFPDETSYNNYLINNTNFFDFAIVNPPLNTNVNVTLNGIKSGDVAHFDLDGTTIIPEGNCNICTVSFKGDTKVSSRSYKEIQNLEYPEYRFWPNLEANQSSDLILQLNTSDSRTLDLLVDSRTQSLAVSIDIANGSFNFSEYQSINDIEGISYIFSDDRKNIKLVWINNNRSNNLGLIKIGELKLSINAMNIQNNDLKLNLNPRFNYSVDEEGREIKLKLNLDFASSDAHFKIYPQPVQESIQISKVNTNVSQFNQYEIFDMRGASIQEGVLSENLELITIPFDKGYKSGLYVVKLFNQNSSVHLKFIKS